MVQLGYNGKTMKFLLYLFEVLQKLLISKSLPSDVTTPPTPKSNSSDKIAQLVDVGLVHMELRRKWFTDTSTIGELYVNGVFQCNTLEDTERAAGVKVYGETAIPLGTYKVTLEEFRNDKNKMYPMLHDVPLFTGIFMHGGNVPADTLGCILLGVYDPKVPNVIGDSSTSRDALLLKLKDAKQIDITILNDKTA